MLSNIWLSNPEASSREPKPNISRRDLRLKISAGRQAFKNQRKTVRKKALDICWTTRLHTPKPAAARVTPMIPDSTLAIRLTLVWVLKLICFVEDGVLDQAKGIDHDGQ